MKLKKWFIDNEIRNYNKQNLSLERIPWRLIGVLLSSILLLGITLGYVIKTTTISHFSDGTYAISNNEEQFSEEKLQELLLEINIQHPKVVLAQAKLETFNFKSQVFKENHNLFGMKLPSVRTTTAKGEQYNHAIYSNWRESVLDYALRQCKYGSNIETDEEYIKYLGDTYAEDQKYAHKLTEIYNQVKL